MPDTDRYRGWLALVTASDRVLVQLALIACGAVLVWEIMRALPARWRARARLVYVGVALSWLLNQVVTSRAALVVLLIACALSAAARVVWVYRRRALRPALSMGAIEKAEDKNT